MADLGAYTVNVKFSDADAHALITACNGAATAIDGQKGTMASARSTGSDKFAGYFSTLFVSNGTTQVKDAGEVSTALRQVATMAGALQKAAQEEQQRRVKARDWEEKQKHRNFLEKAGDGISHLWGGDEPPVGAPAHQLKQSAAAPAAGKRQTPKSGSGGSSGTSSAVPDNLRSFATTTSSDDKALSTHHAAVLKAYTAFASSCGWGSLDASGVVTGFQAFIEANKQEVTWANTIASAFETAGGHGSVCTLSNQALGAALAAAHVSAARTDVTIDMPSVLGGVPTSGYADDPVNTATGNFTEPETDLVFDGGCGALLFTRTYNSASTTVGGFGPGWSSWTETGLLFTPESARWVQPDGRHIVFPRGEDGWGRATGSSFWLNLFGDGFVVSDNAGGRWKFTTSGRLESFDRGAGTRVDAMYGADARLAGLVHERGRSITVEWTGDRVVAVQASDGRRVVYGYDDAGRLIGATGSRGGRRYVWGDGSGLIEQVIDGDGVVEVLNEYDEQGRVATQRSPFGRVSRYSYLPGGVTEVADTDGERSNTWIADEQGRLTGVIDTDGNRQSYRWDAHGNMVQAVDRVGQRTAREYDERGRLVRQLTPEGADLQYGYDDLDRVTTVVAGTSDGAGSDAVTTYEYDGENRNPSVMIDPTGGRTEMVWSNGLLVEVTDPTGVVLRFGYDAHGDLISTTNAVGNVARLERDDAGRVAAAVTPSGHRTTYAYDNAGLLVSRRDPDGGTWRFEHTAAGRLTAQAAPDGGRTEMEYGSNGEESRTIDPLGRAITRELDDLGNLASVRLPDGSTWSYTRDALSRLTETVDPMGGVWSSRYDADGNPVESIDPTGVRRAATIDRANNTVTVDDGLLAATVRLDAFGRPQIITSSDDDGATTVYDACGRVVEILDADGALTLIRRDAAGRPVQVTDPTGVSTEYVYDACGRLAQEIGADGGVTTREYDADSRLVRQTLPSGDVAWARYDACGRLTQVHQPGSGTARYAYDVCGRVTSAVDTWWGTRRFAYDPAGQLTAVTNGLGGVTRFDYDDNGRPVRITDPLGGVTVRVWDAGNRLVSETDPLGRTTAAGYDAAGRQTWQQAPDGHRLAFGYDASGLNVSVSADGALVTSIDRDVARRTQTFSDHTGASSVTQVKEWDRAGRLIRHTRMSDDGASAGFTWSYDAAGRRTSMVDAFGRVTRYGYDAAGRLTTVEHPVLGVATMGYDAAGRLVSATTNDRSGVDTTQRWDWLDGGIVAHTATGPDGVEHHTVIERDADGQVAGIARDGVATRYAYDAARQLTEAITDGVRLSWAFDLGGRLVQHSAGDASESYGYDPAGQLIAVHHGDGTSTTHAYDMSGRRTTTIRPDESAREFEWTTTGWLTRLTETRPGAEAEVTSLLTDAVGQLAAAGQSTLWWDTAAAVPTLVGVGDAAVLPLGAVTGIAGGWSAPGWRAGRADGADPWQVSAVVGLPGGLGITATGTLTLGASAGFGALEWLGARPYDPATQGFLATDPLPPVVGSGWAANPYSYAGNNPLAFSDPTGLHPLSDAELKKQTQGWLADAAGAVGDWVGDNWEYIVAGVVIAGGIVVMATGVGGPIGAAMIAGALMSGGTSIVSQKVTTGNVNWGRVGVDAGIGALAGGATAGVSAGLTSAATALSASESTSAVVSTGARLLGNQAVRSAIAGGTGNALNDMATYGVNNGGKATAGGYLFNGVAGFGIGAGTSALSGLASDKVTDAVGDRMHVPQHLEDAGRHALPTAATIAGNVAQRGVAGAGSVVNDIVAGGDRDPRGILVSAASGAAGGGDVHDNSHQPQHVYQPRHASAH